MTETSDTSSTVLRQIKVWDAPTRIFHWSLLGLVLASWFSGDGEGWLASVHRYSGEAIFGLIVFRLFWGFVGGEHARFSAFLRGRMHIAEHISDLKQAAPKRSLGHNPLGGLAVVAMLLALLLTCLTGLFSDGEAFAGPLATLFEVDLSEVHELSFRAVQGLVALHVAAVIYMSWRTKDGLIPAMITGRKSRRPEEAGTDANTAAPITLIQVVMFVLMIMIALDSLFQTRS
jgi:cytochrome b